MWNEIEKSEKILMDINIANRKRTPNLIYITATVMALLLAVLAWQVMNKLWVDNAKIVRTAQTAKKAVSTIRTAERVMQLAEENINAETETKKSAENNWVTDDGVTVANPYTLEETEQLKQISYPTFKDDGTKNGRRCYHLIDQAITKWRGIPFDEIMNTFKNGKLKKESNGKPYIYSEKWVIPLKDHNGIPKGCTIYRTKNSFNNKFK